MYPPNMSVNIITPAACVGTVRTVYLVAEVLPSNMVIVTQTPVFVQDSTYLTTVLGNTVHHGLTNIAGNL